ncbi:hypothetical protein [Shinella sedimenti]|uniref:Uncharacterized protein n=1 Tax=Shinella sedimenti TaxID=2919913 RepID=A0ABT0CU30_9HYPH|nr:hypothetical protein [Shinella sedimenti]MCJ8152128.1 hypothetical protein [Shinella sedimenti]
MSSGFCGTQNTSGFCGTQNASGFYRKVKYQQVLSQDKYQQQSSRHAFGPAETKGPLQAAFFVCRMKPHLRERSIETGAPLTGDKSPSAICSGTVRHRNAMA